jgi:hypothetical protein
MFDNTYLLLKISFRDILEKLGRIIVLLVLLHYLLLNKALVALLCNIIQKAYFSFVDISRKRTRPSELFLLILIYLKRTSSFFLHSFITLISSPT